MKINSIIPYSKFQNRKIQNFTSNPDNKQAQEDFREFSPSYSPAIFDYLRQDFYSSSNVFSDETSDEVFETIKTNQSKQKVEKLVSLGVKNAVYLEDFNGIRGESVVAKHKGKALKELPNLGIERIIDLKSETNEQKVEKYCQINGLEYFHFPIDFDEGLAQEQVERIPDFIEAIDKKNFYIGCALGTHRTDCALLLYYYFKRNAKNPPELQVTTRSKGKTMALLIKANKITNKICFGDKNKLSENLQLSDEFLSRLGYKSKEEFCEQLKTKKVAMLDSVGVI